ncbi:hypothetical protein VWM68_11290, partial [Campylobacter coli]
LQAAFLGINEIGFSVLSISIVLLCVFIPISYMNSISGLFFNAKLYYEDEFENNARLKKKNSTLGNLFNNLSNNWTNVTLLALV